MGPPSPLNYARTASLLVSPSPTPKDAAVTTGLMILLGLLMAGVVYVLVRGVVGMASGRDVTGEQSQKWMQRRVLLQAVAIVVVILILIIAGSSRS
jgi:hypothetical protein